MAIESMRGLGILPEEENDDQYETEEDHIGVMGADFRFTSQTSAPFLDKKVVINSSDFFCLP